MKFKNVKHPVKDYKTFGIMLIHAIPELYNMIEIQTVIDMYNSLMENDPNMSLKDIKDILPKLKEELKDTINNFFDSKNNLEALNTLGE